ncbi:MAG: putative lipid II flippase FtsW [Actinomycetota bacterium]|nr:putative lipid II flippase FtsW [Actinomycetota bacterium]
MGSEGVATLPRLRVVRPDEVPPAVARARAERSQRRLLGTLAVSASALTLVGLVMVLSASSVSSFAEYGSSFLFFKRQLLYAGVGAGVAVVVARIGYQLWQKLSLVLLLVVIVLLLLVLHPSLGVVAGGAARWLSVGPMSVQPSEAAKLAVIAATASILARQLHQVHDPMRWVLPIVLIVGVVTALILLQPDLGTAVVIGGSVFILLFVAGVKLWKLGVVAVLSGLVGTALILGEGYRRTRLLSFFHPWADPQNTGYQIVQSLIALGSGGLVGVGLGASRQKWMYVPNAHTDFIFSILGEELGLLGEVVVLALFGAFLYSGIRIALRARDGFGRLLAAGITGWLGLQTLINLGAVTGLLPITGVPLPFLSFGGSALVVSLAATGVLFSIGRTNLVRTRPAKKRT